MKFAFLLYMSPEGFAARDDDENQADYVAAWASYMNALRTSGVLTGGNKLQIPQTAHTVHLDAPGGRVQDGPFADSKEQLGGYFIIDAPSEAAAFEWAAKCPTSRIVAVEVRPIWEM